MYDVAIIGGGIVGLATAMRLVEERLGARVLVLEKEARLGAHQTGRNSGVIHAGIYYKPGSAKARLAKLGNESMVRFCARHSIPSEVCGKLIVATSADELPRLEALWQRGRDNGIDVERISPERAREIEPEVQCVAALHVRSTGITSYREVAAKYAQIAESNGAEIRLGCRLERVVPLPDGCALETTQGTFEAAFIVNCAGLHSDRIARLEGARPGAQIVPFRGEYYELVPQKRHLVRGLIYPVPDPAFPFLGVHFTRMIDGSVHCGPNAVLAFAREGYCKRDICLHDLAETLGYGGFWKLARKHWGEGWREMWRSFSKRAFVRSLQRLVPAVTEDDVVRCAAGVRAQALRDDGSLVDDFLFIRGRRSLHVCNAPSPAATASLEIARSIVDEVPVGDKTTVAVA